MHLFAIPLIALAISFLRASDGAPTAQSDDLVYHSYMRFTYCSPSEAIRTPSNLLELKALILTARLTGKTVKAFGSRHSTTDIICTDGIPISMANFNTMRINHDGTATFGAGVKLADATEFLKTQGRSFIHVASYSGISVVGAVGTGAHGSSLKHKTSLSEQLTGLTIINGLGLLRTVTSWDLDFDNFRIHLGVLGVIVDVTLETVPLFKMRSERILVPESILTDGTLVQWTETYDFLEAYWFPSKGQVVVDRGVYLADVNTPGDNQVTRYTNLTEAQVLSLRGVCNALLLSRRTAGLFAMEDYAIRSLYEQVINRVPIFTEDFLTFNNPAVGYAHKLMSSGCSNCSWSYGENQWQFDDTSAGFEVSELPAIVNTIKDVLTRIPATLLFSGVDIRFHRNAKAKLSMAYGRDSVIVEMISPDTLDLTQAKAGVGAYQAIMQAMITKHRGRPHWGKSGLYYHSKDVMQDTVPGESLASFRAAMLRNDPFCTFGNKFAERLAGKSNKMDTNPAFIHCALRDSCICGSDTDCGSGQTCSDLVDGTYTYKICKDVNIYENKPVLAGSYDPRNLTSVIVAIFS